MSQEERAMNSVQSSVPAGQLNDGMVQNLTAVPKASDAVVDKPSLSAVPAVKPPVSTPGTPPVNNSVPVKTAPVTTPAVTKPVTPVTTHTGETQWQKEQREKREATIKRNKALHSQLRPIYDRLLAAFDIKEMQDILERGEHTFHEFGELYSTPPEGTYKGRWYIHQKNEGSRILAVAHVDTVQQNRTASGLTRTAFSKCCVFSPACDDRAGAYIILKLLPKIGIITDILITTDEEKGASTADLFKPERDYNWMVEFDRKGCDVALYEYETPEYKAMLEDCGFETARGTFTDICRLYEMERFAFNVAIGYENPHAIDAYIDINTMLWQVARFVHFYNLHGEHVLEHKKKVTYQRGRRSAQSHLDIDGDWDHSGYDGYGRPTDRPGIFGNFRAGNPPTGDCQGTPKKQKGKSPKVSGGGGPGSNRLRSIDVVGNYEKRLREAYEEEIETIYATSGYDFIFFKDAPPPLTTKSVPGDRVAHAAYWADFDKFVQEVEDFNRVFVNLMNGRKDDCMIDPLALGLKERLKAKYGERPEPEPKRNDKVKEAVIIDGNGKAKSVKGSQATEKVH